MACAPICAFLRLLVGTGLGQNACSVRRIWTTAEHVRKAEVIFLGRVLVVEELPKDQNPHLTLDIYHCQRDKEDVDWLYMSKQNPSEFKGLRITEEKWDSQ